MDTERTYTAFAGDHRVATGSLRDVLLAAKAHVDRGDLDPLLFFEDDTGRQIDFDLRGTPEEVVARAMPPTPHPGPGRPKLGVVAREVTLLPRHWEWLEAQPQGISGTLRRLVEDAKKRAPEEETARRAIEAASRVMTALAGDRPGYEEASRALFARDKKRFDALVRPWPEDIRKHLQALVRGAMRADGASAEMKPSAKKTTNKRPASKKATKAKTKRTKGTRS